jgi:hypothetical protein
LGGFGILGRETISFGLNRYWRVEENENRSLLGVLLRWKLALRSVEIFVIIHGQQREVCRVFPV